MANGAHLRWMAFVDGENFTMQGQELAKSEGIALTGSDYYRRDEFLWFPGRAGFQALGNPNIGGLQHNERGTRSYYYTSVQGSDEDLVEVKESLYSLGFDPQVFKRPKNRHSKGVDIALARDMLCHAFRGNYDLAYLAAGDGDYLPLVEELKRLGKLVFVAFFLDHGLSDDLRLASDRFVDVTDEFRYAWSKRRNDPIPQR